MAINPHHPRAVILAFWRLNGEEREFFVPLDGEYLEVMSTGSTRPPSQAGRALAKGKWGINPQSNAKVFRQRNNLSVVVFTLTNIETDAIAKQGVWLSLSELTDPHLYDILRDVSERL